MKKYAWILLAAILLSACSSGNSFARTPEEDQSPLMYVCIEDTFFNGSIEEELYRQAYTLDDRYEDEALQQMISTVELDYPIDTQEEIRTVSWALYDIAIATELFDPELKPNSAERYAEGIWHFTFNKMESSTTYYDGDQASFLISGEDGHIIALRTEMMFLDAHSSGSWKIYNGSEDLAPGERHALLRITWEDIPYEDQLYPFEDHTVEDRWEDAQWQDIAARVKAQYPLIERTQITDWAWDFVAAAAEAGLVDPQYTPWYANHYSSGIWVLTFEPGAWGESMDGPRLIVLISDADGHVIHVEENT